MITVQMITKKLSIINRFTSGSNNGMQRAQTLSRQNVRRDLICLILIWQSQIIWKMQEFLLLYSTKAVLYCSIILLLILFWYFTFLVSNLKTLWFQQTSSSLPVESCKEK